jgi:hypothetical protein
MERDSIAFSPSEHSQNRSGDNGELIVYDFADALEVLSVWLRDRSPPLDGLYRNRLPCYWIYPTQTFVDKYKIVLAKKY